MRVGYFGGSFDPPHRGHLAVAGAAARAFALDSVLFVPTSHQPLKPGRTQAGYADRLAMVELLCAEAAAADLDPARGPARFVASAIEAPLPGDPPRYTVDTLETLRANYAPDDRLFVIAGADAFLQLPQWRAPERLLALAEWIVVSRPGFDAARLEALIDTLTATCDPGARARIHPLRGLADPTSATTLRRALAQQPPTAESERTLAEGLPPPLLAYMRAHRLYGL
jgi:nicotinate-nucleotide adenylyltransferase